jgi:hypothetical protein
MSGKQLTAQNCDRDGTAGVTPFTITGAGDHITVNAIVNIA